VSTRSELSDIKIGETPANEMVVRRVNHRVTDAMETMDGAGGQCLHQVPQMERPVPADDGANILGRKWIHYSHEGITNNENRELWGAYNRREACKAQQKDGGKVRPAKFEGSQRVTAVRCPRSHWYPPVISPEDL